LKPLPSFSLHRPKTLREALELIRELEEAKPIAGGTDLLLLLRDGACKAKHLVDLSLIEELRHIREEGDQIHVGATTTHNQLRRSPLIAEKASVLREACSGIGSVQIRNLGTIGGNLCNASPAADTAPPLLVLDSKVEIASHEGSRSIPLVELFAGPKLNSLQPHELLTEIRFPVSPKGAGMSFQRLGRRKGCTLSVVNAAAYLELDGDTCRQARLALGAVAPTPLRMKDAEEMLKGRRLSQRLIEEAASACHKLVSPVDDVRASAEYRREMSCVLIRRALNEAWHGARRNMQ
jgi:CO/xanthine dehydrogenase FAD-binding subunit